MAKNVNSMKDFIEIKSNESSSGQKKAMLIKKNKKKSPLSGFRTIGTSEDVDNSLSVVTPSPQDLNARIASRAYDLYLRRCGGHGRDLADWLEAESQVLSESSQSQDNQS